MTTNTISKVTVNTQYDFETWLEVEYGYTYSDYNHMNKFERASLRKEYNAQYATN